MSSQTSEGAALQSAAPRTTGTANLAIAAALGTLAVLALTLYCLLELRAVLLQESAHSLWVDLLLVVLAIAAAFLLLPLSRSLAAFTKAKQALALGERVEARVALAASRNHAWLALGYSALVICLVGFVLFLLANELAVGRTFFDVALIVEFFPLVGEAFWYNVLIFMIAEALVLVWGLVVAIARLMPGKAGAPVRFLATAYCDIFRGLPAIIVIYLIGFGLPLTGIQFFREIPVTTFPILALTLTYGAYVAEVYRAGIQSIHWSQLAAARSLGLSYTQGMRFVIVPQAVRRIGPPLLNDFIGLQKDTALVSVIGVIDAFNQSRIVAANHFNLSAVTIVALIFLLITIPQARLVDRMVDRDQQRMRAQG